MADQLVRVKFKNGTIKELSAHVANNEGYQKSLGFAVLSDSAAVEKLQVEIPEKKIVDEPEEKNPVAPDKEEELTAQVETAELPQEEKTEKKKGGRPKKSTTKTK